jgi:hypothetical protein
MEALGSTEAAGIWHSRAMESFRIGADEVERRRGRDATYFAALCLWGTPKLASLGYQTSWCPMHLFESVILFAAS